MPIFFHCDCFFDSFFRGRFGSTRLNDTDALEGFSSLTKADQTMLRERIARERSLFETLLHKTRGTRVNKGPLFWEIKKAAPSSVMITWGRQDEQNFHFHITSGDTDNVEKAVAKKIKAGYIRDGGDDDDMAAV